MATTVPPSPPGLAAGSTPIRAATVTIADEGKRLRLYTRLLFAVVWVVPGIVAALAVWSAGRGRGDPYSLGTALLWQGGAWAMWAVWTQGILWLVKVVPLGAEHFGRWLSVHLVACCVVVIVTLSGIAWLDWHYSHGLEARTYGEVLRLTVVRHLDFELVMYWAVLGAAYMVEFVRRYRERDRAAQALEQKLARQQLEALRMQLNPHFLFNALNSVTELMEMDVRHAQRALSQVSDLLRQSLRSATNPTIPLWREIELVELYLQVARIRYGDELSVDIQVDSATVDLDVPSFVLQPLVENALKHGLSPSAKNQAIWVSARRHGPMLELIVEDNGRGLDGRITDSGRFAAVRPSVDGLGIGLTNTRSRLTIMYGDRYAFRMTTPEHGGCRVEIRLPVHG